MMILLGIESMKKENSFGEWRNAVLMGTRIKQTPALQFLHSTVPCCICNTINKLKFRTPQLKTPMTEKG